MKYRNLLAATIMAASFGTYAFAGDAIVSTINVNADFEAVDSSMAMKFWPTIESDLKKKLGESLAARAGENGVDIDVSIRELTLNAAATDASYSDLNGIDGVVAIRGPEEDSPTKSFRVAYSVVPPTDSVPQEGIIVLQPDTADNYAALIDAIVAEVRKQVDQIEM